MTTRKIRTDIRSLLAVTHNMRKELAALHDTMKEGASSEETTELLGDLNGAVEALTTAEEHLDSTAL